MNPLPIETRLDLKWILEELRSDGVGDYQLEDILGNGKSAGQSNEHSLEAIARQKWKHQKHPAISITLDWLSTWLAKHIGIEYVDVTQSDIVEPAALAKIGASYAFSRQLLPIRLNRNILTVATAEPLLVTQWISEIKDAFLVEAVPVMANPAALRKAIDRFYNRSFEPADGSSERAAADWRRKVISINPQTTGNLTDAKISKDTTSIVDTILQIAFDKKASDIHIEPHEDIGDVRIRIDGVLHPIMQLPVDKIPGCVSRLKVMGNLNIAERRLPQDGRMKVRSRTGREVEIRMSSMPCFFGEKLVLRLFNSDALIRNIDELGFESDERALWDRMTNHPHGLLLVTGPTGSGKTTTLYAALRAMANPKINIATIEDPIELIDSRFNQMQVNSSIGLTFPMGIRTILRQDPDVIMVGEIRDSESADVAIQAALTGHLVFATIHTNDAPSTITRLLDLSVPPFLIKAALVGVVAQRLVRKLCEACKEPIQLPRVEWDFLTTPIRLNRPEQIYRSIGCEKCSGIGFRGRIGIYEMLYLIEPIQRLITPAADTMTIRRVALRSGSGMTPLRVSGAKRISDGHTTVQEVLRVIPPELERF